METFDVFFRYVVLPMLGAAALVGIVVTVREFVRDYRNGTL